MNIKELFSISENKSVESVNFLEKKDIYNLKNNNKSTIVLGAFTILFFFSISLAILNKPVKSSESVQTQYTQQEEIVEINSPVPYPNSKSNSKSISQSTEVMFRFILDYSTQIQQESFPNYYKKVQPNEFINLNTLNNDLTKKKILSLENIAGDYSLVKAKFMEEDIVMSPFKKGTVNVTSKIISISESSNLISVELLKSYTQNNKEVDFLQLKIFDKDKLAQGNFIPSTNLLSTNLK